MEHNKRLAEQAQKSAEDQEKVRAAAKADIERFKAERALKAEKARQENRLEEEETRKSLHHTLNEGSNSWERIVGLIDLKAKSEGKDVSRLKKLLLDMKAAQKEAL